MDRFVVAGWFAASLGVLVLAGCSETKPELPKCYPVSGQVIIDGTPAVRALVSFHPESPQADGKKYVGQTTTGDHGEFAMTTFAAGDGAPSGNYVVTIAANWVSKDGQDIAVPDLLKGEYADPATSPLKVTVAEEPLILEPYDFTAK